uniref:Uncharacterized protein n=1 Tax=Anguilla anguilla TaxID=7936 RepID=A0A0E9PA35_ANGAN
MFIIICNIFMLQKNRLGQEHLFHLLCLSQYCFQCLTV